MTSVLPDVSSTLLSECRDALIHSGWGPLQPLMADDQVEEIWWNDPSQVFCARSGRSELTTVALTESEARDLVMRAVLAGGRRLDTSRPFVDTQLADGSRLHAVIPEITRRHWAVNIRRYPVRPARLTDLVATGTLSMAAAEFLDSAAAAGANVIVAGGTQAGKTTILNALLGGLPAAERIISCEEVREIRIEHPDWVALQTRDSGVEGTGAVDLRDLVRESLRMRPSRVVVGEVRGAEALDLLLAMNCGIPCSATLHANSAEDAVAKLCGLPLLAGPNIASGFVSETVMSCVDLVVHVTLQPGGERRVSQICSVLPGAAGPLLGRIFLRRDGELVRGSAEVPASLRQVVTP